MVNLVTNDKNGNIIIVEDYQSSEKEDIINTLITEIREGFNIDVIGTCSDNENFDDDISFDLYCKDIKRINDFFFLLETEYKGYKNWIVEYIADHTRIGWNSHHSNTILIHIRPIKRCENKDIMVSLISFLQEYNSQGA